MINGILYNGYEFGQPEGIEQTLQFRKNAMYILAD